MDVEQIRALIVDLSAVGTDFDKLGLKSLHRACSIIEDITSAKVTRLINSAGRKPVLQVFMSDGWSTDIRARDDSFVGQVRVTRSGRLRTEFVLQRVIVKCRVGDEMRLAIKIARPRCLATKKCIDLWSAACDFQPMLKLMGHAGVSISLYLQDGLFAKPFGNRMMARHDLFFEAGYCPLEFECDADRMLAELRDWTLFWKCSAHSASLALKWGLRQFVIGDLLESVHISIAALLRASAGLLGEVAHFIAGYAAFDRPTPTSLHEVEFFWTFLDIDVALVELFVRVNPIWDGEKLRVSAALSDDQDAIAAITTCIKDCMRWTDFSETRWTRVGQSGSFFLRSLCIGIDKIAKLASDTDALSNWHLNGFKRATSEVRLYLALAAAAARPSEALLLELMEDDRLLLHADKYWEVLEDEMKYLLDAPLSFWQSIAGVLQVSAHDLRRWVVDATVTSIGYLWMDIWRHFSQAPWKYAIGDVRKKTLGI